MSANILTMGIDVGSSLIKCALANYSDKPEVIDQSIKKIRKRNPSEIAEEMIAYMLSKNNFCLNDVKYLASTGEGEMVVSKTGHFYSMTTHSRGAKFFYPKVRTIVDMGALYVRAIKVNENGKVMDYKMTGQCASGSGQFIENISRYLGLSIEEVGDISIQADNPELPSGICAVLAETDVINSVSRGISTPNIIKGIHLSIANRIVRLLASLRAESPVVLVGGMAMNRGMVQAVSELVKESKYDYEIITNPNAIYSGAIGASLWAGYRYCKIKEKEIVETSS